MVHFLPFPGLGWLLSLLTGAWICFTITLPMGRAHIHLSANQKPTQETLLQHLSSTWFPGTPSLPHIIGGDQKALSSFPEASLPWLGPPPRLQLAKCSCTLWPSDKAVDTCRFLAPCHFPLAWITAEWGSPNSFKGWGLRTIHALEVEEKWASQISYFPPRHTDQPLTGSLPNILPGDGGPLRVTAGCTDQPPPQRSSAVWSFAVWPLPQAQIPSWCCNKEMLFTWDDVV